MLFLNKLYKYIASNINHICEIIQLSYSLHNKNHKGTIKFNVPNLKWL